MCLTCCEQKLGNGKGKIGISDDPIDDKPGRDRFVRHEGDRNETQRDKRNERDRNGYII